jgi:hypothetical protein
MRKGGKGTKQRGERHLSLVLCAQTENVVILMMMCHDNVARCFSYMKNDFFLYRMLGVGFQRSPKSVTRRLQQGVCATSSLNENKSESSLFDICCHLSSQFRLQFHSLT